MSILESKASKEERNRSQGTALAQFFKGLIRIEDVTATGSADPNDYAKTAARNSMIALLLKCILPIPILQEIGMMPPNNCEWDNWVCCLGPCKGLMSMRGINAKLIKLLRWANGSCAPSELRAFDAFIDFWSGAPTRTKVKDSADYGYFMSIFLAPVSMLPTNTVKLLTKKFPSLAGKENKLFLCVDHFKEMLGSKDSNVSKAFSPKRELFEFSTNNISKDLESGKLKLSTGNISSQSLVYIDQLLPRSSFTNGVNYSYPSMGNLTLEGWIIELERRIDSFVHNVATVWHHTASLFNLQEMSLEVYKNNISLP